MGWLCGDSSRVYNQAENRWTAPIMKRYEQPLLSQPVPEAVVQDMLLLRASSLRDSVLIIQVDEDLLAKKPRILVMGPR